MTKSKAKLKVVPKPADKPLVMADDIYAKARAEIRARDWARVHIAADKRLPFAPQHTPTKAAP